MRTRRSTVIKTSKKTWKDGQPKAYNSSTFPKSGLLPALHIYRSSRGGWKTGEDAVEGCPVKWYLDYNSRVSRELRSSFIGDSRLTRAVALENKNSPFGFQIHRSVLNSTTHSRILNTWYSLNIRYWIFECCNRNGISCFGLKLEIRSDFLRGIQFSKFRPFRYLISCVTIASTFFTIHSYFSVITGYFSKVQSQLNWTRQKLNSEKLYKDFHLLRNSITRQVFRRENKSSKWFTREQTASKEIVL